MIISHCLILRNSEHGRSSESQVEVSLCQTHLQLQGISPLVCLTPYARKRGLTLSLESLINGKGMDLNVCNLLTLVYCAFPDHLLQQSLPPTSPAPNIFFCLQMAFKVGAADIVERYSVVLGLPWIQEVCMLLNFCLFLSC